MSKTPEQRFSALEERMDGLTKWRSQQECNRHLLSIGQRITDRLFELGPDKVDMRLIAKLSAALGCDVMPLSNNAPKKARKYATKGIKTKKP
jgi:hypothetical protein